MIEEVFNNLSAIAQGTLMCKFNEIESFFIEYESGKVIGCHKNSLDLSIVVIETSGFWYLGVKV